MLHPLKSGRPFALAVAAAFLTVVAPVRAQDFTLTIGQKIDATVAARSSVLKNGTAPPVEYACGLIPLTSGQPGSFDVSAQKGKVTVLYFFSASCGRCIEASQQLGSIFLNTPSSELTVLGVMPSTDSFEDALKAATKERVPFTVLQDVSNQTYNAYGIYGYPTICIIDSSGKVVKYCNADRMRFFVMAELIKNRRARGIAALPAAAQPR